MFFPSRVAQFEQTVCMHFGTVITSVPVSQSKHFASEEFPANDVLPAILSIITFPTNAVFPAIQIPLPTIPPNAVTRVPATPVTNQNARLLMSDALWPDIHRLTKCSQLNDFASNPDFPSHAIANLDGFARRLVQGYK